MPTKAGVRAIVRFDAEWHAICLPNPVDVAEGFAMEALAGMGAFTILLLMVLWVLWFFLPFAVFGTKPRLDKLHAEQQATNDLLRQLIGEMQAARGYQAPPKPFEHSQPVQSPEPDATSGPQAPPASAPQAAAAATPYDERAEKIARARALAAKVKPSSPGENRME